jgi:AcrR family transcriptional regulator
MTTDVEASPRDRLLTGVIDAVVEKGYAAVTIADIVRCARASKRTFYEHFADKENCFLTAYEAMSELLLRHTLAAAEGDQPVPQRIRTATHAYFQALQDQPAGTHAMLTEIEGVGESGRKLRRDEQRRFAEGLRGLVEAGRKGLYASTRPLTPQLALAVVGGINELTLQAVSAGDTARLTDLTETCAEMLEAILLRP